MCYDIHRCIVLQFHFYTDLLYWYLTWRRPVWRGSGQLKYCFKHTTSYQPCSSLWLIWFNFQVWLIRSHGEIRSSIKQDLCSRLCSLFVFFSFVGCSFLLKRNQSFEFHYLQTRQFEETIKYFFSLSLVLLPSFRIYPCFHEELSFPLFLISLWLRPMSECG